MVVKEYQVVLDPSNYQLLLLPPSHFLLHALCPLLSHLLSLSLSESLSSSLSLFFFFFSLSHCLFPLSCTGFPSLQLIMIRVHYRSTQRKGEEESKRGLRRIHTGKFLQEFSRPGVFDVPTASVSQSVSLNTSKIFMVED